MILFRWFSTVDGWYRVDGDVLLYISDHGFSDSYTQNPHLYYGSFLKHALPWTLPELPIIGVVCERFSGETPNYPK